MIWIEQGGLLMWPLLALSLIAVAVIIDRAIVFSTFSLPNEEEQEKLLKAISENKTEEAGYMVEECAPSLLPLVQTLCSTKSFDVRERLATLRCEEIIRNLDLRLSTLAVTGRVAPLLGLLGTVIGMIHTFSQLSSTQGGAIDMTLLADGIWQALITTASGLIIAIPAVLAHQAFVKKEDDVAFTLGRFANTALGPEKK